MWIIGQPRQQVLPIGAGGERAANGVIDILEQGLVDLVRQVKALREDHPHVGVGRSERDLDSSGARILSDTEPSQMAAILHELNQHVRRRGRVFRHSRSHRRPPVPGKCL